jgi:hypothetical protein
LTQGLFGTNFFAFDFDNHRILYTSMIWIYFAVSAGLTVITLAIYWWITGRLKNSIDPSRVQSDPTMSLRRGYTDLKEKKGQASQYFGV